MEIVDHKVKIRTKDGKEFVGRIFEKTGENLILKDVYQDSLRQREFLVLATEEIELIKPNYSIMDKIEWEKIQLRN